MSAGFPLGEINIYLTLLVIRMCVHFFHVIDFKLLYVFIIINIYTLIFAHLS